MAGWKEKLSGVVFENPPLETLSTVSSPKREGDSIEVTVTNGSAKAIHYQDYLNERPTMYTEERFEGNGLFRSGTPAGRVAKTGLSNLASP